MTLRQWFPFCGGNRGSILVEKLANAPVRSISAATYVEMSMVLSARRGEPALRELDTWLAEGAIRVIPVSVTLAKVARRAFLQFGKGRHPAALNFGDCFSYALAKQLNEPLLFIGNDFSQTDVRIA